MFFLIANYKILIILPKKPKTGDNMIKSLIKSLVAILTIVLITQCKQKQKHQAWYLNSPDEKVSIMIQHSSEADSSRPELSYNVIMQGDTVIKDASLGVIKSDGDLSKDLSFISATAVDESEDQYTLIAGKHKKLKADFREMTLRFGNTEHQMLNISFRAYRDGVAFKYSLEGNDTSKHTIIGETTSFKLALNGNAWMHQYDSVTDWAPAYESFYQNAIKIGTNAPEKEGWGFPLLFNVNDKWLLISETNLTKAYHASHIAADCSNGNYKIVKPEASEAKNLYSNDAQNTLPWEMPWRFIAVGTSPAIAIETELHHHLSNSCKINDTSWIKPGRSSWSWWGDHPSSKNFKSLKDFVDLSVEMGWEYSLVDANWDIMTGGNIEELIQYANSKNVGILMWYNSGGAHNIVTERPRDIMSDPAKRKEEMKKLQSWGVKGIKVDFFQSDKQTIIKQYIDILEDAAEHQILVNFHGCTLPRGWERTYPNMISSEAVIGAEAYAFNKNYPENAPWHNTILPFTRNAVGPMDYTPVTFGNQKFARMTSWGHELALSIVFQSGITHMADRAKEYRALPVLAKDFLKLVPSAWDETKYISGTPGDYVILARRNGNTWYLGGIQGKSMIRDFEFNIDFVGKDSCEVQIITDGNTAKSFSGSNVLVKKGDLVKVKMLPFGGFVATIK